MYLPESIVRTVFLEKYCKYYVLPITPLALISRFRIRNYRLLTEMLEHSMKFSFNEPHTWTQFGLSLSTDGKHFRSLLVFRELAAKHQADAGACLCTARLCYERLHLHEEGLEWARRALRKDDSTSEHALRARANLFVGVGLTLRWKAVENHTERSALMAEAERHFQAANRADPADYLTEYYLAYHYAQSREVGPATEHARKALTLNPDHLHSLHLMALLLSAQKRFPEALDVCDQTLEEFPDNLPLMSLKVRLEEVVNGGEAAVLTTKGEQEGGAWPGLDVVMLGRHAQN